MSKGISDREEREITQLLLVADYYLWKADRKGAGSNPMTMRQAADLWKPSAPATPDKMKTLCMGADLSSSAIRLATIDEILEKKTGWPREPQYSCVTRYFCARGLVLKMQIPPDMLNVLMRDNIGHRETVAPSTSSNLKVDQRWGQRQDYLLDLKISEAFEHLKRIASAIRADLLSAFDCNVPAFVEPA